MRPETKVIKNNIKKDFPGAKISVKYVPAANYASSSDTIKIKTDINYKTVVSYLKQHTKGVVIYQKGQVGSKGGDFGSRIFDKTSDAEFIEIEVT